jgi:hypothetical protein
MPSSSPKTLGKHRKVRVLSSPLKNPGFPRVFCISGQFLWPSVAPMQLGAWRLRRCISRRAAQIESFFESRDSPKHLGSACASLTPIHARRGGRIRTRHVINPAASVASGLRALTCLSLLSFRKRKNLTILTIIRVLPIPRHCPCRGGVKATCLIKEEILI